MHKIRVSRQELCHIMMTRALNFLDIFAVEIEQLKGVEYTDNVCVFIQAKNGPKNEGHYVHLYWNTDDPEKPVLMTDITTPEGRVSPAPGTPLAVMARLLFAVDATPDDFVYWPKMAREIAKVIEECIDVEA